MPRENSAGAVVFRIEGGEPLYLLLHYPGAGRRPRGYWDFPKGHVEQGETEEATVRREVREETGLRDLLFVRGFRERINYFFQKRGKKIFKVVVFYVCKTKEKDVKVSFEHTGFQWVPFHEAMHQLKFGNAKHILSKAHQFLQRQGAQRSAAHPQRQDNHL